MAWTSIGDFKILTGDATALTKNLTVFQDELYCSTWTSGVASDQIWKYDGISWSLELDDTDLVVFVQEMFTFDNTLFIMKTGGAGDPTNSGIFSYDGAVLTQEWSSASLMSWGQFLEFNNELYAIYASYLLKRNPDGTWSTLDPPSGSGGLAGGKTSIGEYAGDIYVATREGSPLGSATMKLYRYNNPGFTFIGSFGNAGKPGDELRHGVTSLQEYDGRLFAVDAGRYVDVYDGSTYTQNQAWNYDAVSAGGEVDAIVFNNKLWTGHVFDSGFALFGGVYTYDGTTWLLNSGLNLYSDERAAPYNPPMGFVQWGLKLYACAGPGEVWVNSEEAPPPVSSDVRALGIDKGVNDLLWVTFYKPNGLYVRTYVASTLVPVAETFIGVASADSVAAGTTVAYPYCPPGTSNMCLVFGNFGFGSGSQIILSTDGGSNWSVIENGWGNDRCGSLIVRNGIIYAVRNKQGAGHLYRGSGPLNYLSSLSFPINWDGLELGLNGNYLIAGNKNTQNTPRIMITSYPFTFWRDLTYNYPVSGQVTSIVALRS